MVVRLYGVGEGCGRLVIGQGQLDPGEQSENQFEIQLFSFEIQLGRVVFHAKLNGGQRHQVVHDEN